MVNIQLFTDGGVFTHKKISVSVGLMTINRKEIITCKKLNHNKDSDFAELFAINKLLSRTYGYSRQKNMFDDNYHVSIYTDSLTSISSILSNRDAVDNERRTGLLNEIRDTINKFDNRVSFYHIKSHISGSNLKLAHIMFCKENNVEIPFSEFLFIYQQNKKCDKLVAKEYKKYHKQKKIEERMLELKDRDLKMIEEFDIDAI